MRKIGIVQNGGAAAVIKGGRDHTAVPGRTSAANTITLKHLIGKEEDMCKYIKSNIFPTISSVVSIKLGGNIFVIKTCHLKIS